MTPTAPPRERPVRLVTKPCARCGNQPRAANGVYCHTCANEKGRAFRLKQKTLRPTYVVYRYGDPCANEPPLVEVGTATVRKAGA